MQVDVPVVGGGPGSTPAEMALASAGRNVLRAEQGAGLGGICLSEGCIPSKIHYESAQRLMAIRRAGEFGLQVPAGEIGIDWAAIMARKSEILGRRATGALEKARHNPSLTVQFGSVSLEGPRQARIVPYDGTPHTVTSTDAIIAIGSIPKRLAIPGTDLPSVLSSEQILSIADLHRRLEVIGAGPTEVEMAPIFAAFSSNVTLIETISRMLAQVDEEIALALQAHIGRQGIDLVLDARVFEITGNDGGVRISYRTVAVSPPDIGGQYRGGLHYAGDGYRRADRRRCARPGPRPSRGNAEIGLRHPGPRDSGPAHTGRACRLATRRGRRGGAGRAAHRSAGRGHSPTPDAFGSNWLRDAGRALGQDMTRGKRPATGVASIRHTGHRPGVLQASPSCLPVITENQT